MEAGRVVGGAVRPKDVKVSNRGEAMHVFRHQVFGPLPDPVFLRSEENKSGFIP